MQYGNGRWRLVVSTCRLPGGDPDGGPICRRRRHGQNIGGEAVYRQNPYKRNDFLDWQGVLRDCSNLFDIQHLMINMRQGPV